MTVDFFIAKCQIENINESEFGICDDEDEDQKTQAYIDTTQRDKWIAIVKNKTDKAINFIAVDNCIEIRRNNNEMEFRCDAN